MLTQQKDNQAAQTTQASKLYGHSMSRLNNSALNLHRNHHHHQQQQHYYQQLARGQQPSGGTVTSAYLPTSYYEQPASIYSRQQQQDGRSVSALMQQQQQAHPSKLSHHYHTMSAYQQQQYQHRQHYQSHASHQQQQQRNSLMVSSGDKRQSLSLHNKPLCRCRVMYLGSSVPHKTKNGLHGIQEPLKHLYPEEQFASGASRQTACQATLEQPVATIDISHLSSSLGIDSWLSVWSNGLLLENVDEFGREIKRFFSIESLHYCAAVRFFDTKNLMPREQQASASGRDFQGSSFGKQLDQQQTDEMLMTDQNNNTNNSEQLDDPVEPVKETKSLVRFLPLDAPLFQWPGMVDANHPPLFAAIMRRTTGVKVLECHAFICRRDAASNALVRCCTQAYADFLSAKRLSLELAWRMQPASPEAGDDRDKSQHQGRSSSRRRGSSGSGASGSRKTAQKPGAYEAPAAPLVSLPGGHEAIGGASHSANSTNGTQSTTEEPLSPVESPVSEDNYAIIMRHTANPASGQKAKQDGKQQKRERSKVQGSSKSLFRDFQPVISAHDNDLKDDCEQCDMEKMSHSLDLLDIRSRQAVEATCCGDALALGADDPLQGNKRHSRSMQNLGNSEFSAKSSSRRRKERRPSASSGCSGTSGNSQRRHRRKRASSLHELVAQPTYEPLDSVRVPSNNVHQQPDEQQNHLPLNSAAVYATCMDAGEPTEAAKAADCRLNGLAADDGAIRIAGEVIQDESSSQVRRRRRSDHEHRSSTSTTTSRRRRRQLDQQQQQQLPLELLPLPPPLPLMPMSPNGTSYYAAHPYSLYSPLPHHAPPASSAMYLPGPGACYLPPPAHYHPNHAAAAAAALAAHHQRSQHHNSRVFDYHQPPSMADSNFSQRPSFASATLGRPLKGKASLPRFRCLSPPIKLLAGSSVLSRSQKGAQRDSLPTNGASLVKEETSTDRHERQASSGAREEQLSPVDAAAKVVSARPVFLGGEPTASSATGNKKRTSWIKRLSLTMSPAAAVSVAPQHLDLDGDKTVGATTGGDDRSAPVANGAEEPLVANGGGGGVEMAKTQVHRKKRASLFSGTLTFGRRRRRQQQQSMEQTGDPDSGR